MQDSNNVNRRKVIKILGTSVIGAAGLGSQTTFAQGQTQTNEVKSYLHNFNPSDSTEVKKAVGQLRSIETRDRAEKILFNLSRKRKKALIRAIKQSIGVELKTEDEVIDQPSEAQLPDEMISDIGTNSLPVGGSRTYHCKGKLVNSAGTTEGVFDHYVHWSYGGSVSDFGHWKKVSTPGWLTYWNGMTTNYIDNRGDYGVSKMGGNFEACVTNYGCYLSETIGSGIWVYANGDVASNAWDQTG